MKDERISKTENRPTREDTRAEARPNRVPINGIKDILNVSGIREGYHACWVNEKNVPQYIDAGYTFVDNDVSFGSLHPDQANPHGARYTRNVGGYQTAYLMEIPQEYFDADRAAEEEERIAQEATMFSDARQEGLDHGDLGMFRARTRT